MSRLAREIVNRDVGEVKDLWCSCDNLKNLTQNRDDTDKLNLSAKPHSRNRDLPVQA